MATSDADLEDRVERLEERLYLIEQRVVALLEDDLEDLLKAYFACVYGGAGVVLDTLRERRAERKEATPEE